MTVLHSRPGSNRAWHCDECGRETFQTHATCPCGIVAEGYWVHTTFWAFWRAELRRVWRQFWFLLRMAGFRLTHRSDS